MVQLTTLGGVLLGLLMRKPMSGYELAQHLKYPVSNYWQAKHSQIYPELARLRSHALVSYERVEQRDRPAKKVYSITEQGKSAVKEWVNSEPAPIVPRDELLLKASMLWMTDPAGALRLYRGYEARHRARLAQYEATKREREAEHGDDLFRLDAPHFSDYVTLMRGIGYEQERATWCGWVADQIERLSGTIAPDIAGPEVDASTGE